MYIFQILWISVALSTLLTREPLNIKELFNQLPSDPEALVFTNKIPFNNEGGHLQGIQMHNFNGAEYVFLSGSSSTYGYLAVAYRNEVRKLHRLMFKPFKHAGGFQIHNEWLAVGVEDNNARNASVVQVYKLGDPLSDLNAPVAVIERSGERERATAGAVAIQQVGKTLWVVVGDWSNRHMDFYKAELTIPHTNIQFRKTGEIDMTTCPKHEWIDPLARPFQNINLLQMKDELYLVGFAGDETSDANIIDVFTIGDLSGSTPVLTKIFTRKFPANADTKFRWGAGLSFNGHDRLSIYSCAEHINTKVTVSLYR